MNLSEKYRPKLLDQICGQNQVKEFLSNWLKDPSRHHVLLFQGESGTGKTTAAKIIANELDLDLDESNAGTESGIDKIRSLVESIDTVNVIGKSRLFLIDEAHALSQAAKNALLIPLESAFKHDYIIFCTTEVSKIPKPFRDRCTELKFLLLNLEDLSGCLRKILNKENRDITDSIFEFIVEKSYGSPRLAIKNLETYLLTGETTEDTGKNSNIVFTLWDYKKTSSDLVLEFDENELSPESLRIVLLNSFYNTILKQCKTKPSNEAVIKKAIAATKILVDLGECPDNKAGKSSMLLALLSVKSVLH